MSTLSLRDRGATVRDGVVSARAFLVRTVFGDGVGLLVFLCCLAAGMMLWRTTVTITDNYTLAHGLAALADGHLFVDQLVYTTSYDTPGMVVVDGQPYARNYGQLALALPFLWLLRGVGAVAEPRIALAAAWSLVVLAAFLVGGRLLERERLASVGGSVVALAVFAANVTVATPLPREQYYLLALQASSLVAAALLAVVVYRLLARAHGREVGIVAGAASVLATPIVVWASIPKRHVFSALFVVCVAYLLYRSRTADSLTTYRRFRAIAYVPVAATAWIHAAEGLVLFVALVAVDVGTARRHDVRTVATVAGVFAFALAPFLLTNALIAGDPLESPRMLPDYQSGSVATMIAPFALVSIGVVRLAHAAGPVVVGAPAGVIPEALVRFADLLGSGVHAVATESDRLVGTFVRSGYPERVAGRGRPLAVDVAFLEALPLAGSVLAAPLAYRNGLEWNPERTVDAFFGVYAALLVLLYLPRLPLHVQFTVRYLLPLYPVAVYGVARLPWVRTVVRDRWDWLAWTYAAGVLIGGQLMFGSMLLLDASTDEAFQGYALLGLAFAILLAGWSFASALGHEDTRVGSIVLGLASATTTNFMFIAGLYYFASGAQYALSAIPSG